MVYVNININGDNVISFTAWEWIGLFIGMIIGGLAEA